MKIAIGSDPNAEGLKDVLIRYVRSLGHEITDFGSKDPVYANVSIAVAQKVAAGDFDRGILLCGTGIGVSISANKVDGVYAALVTDVYQAQRAQLSNNANVIALGAQVTGIELAKSLIKEYLANEFDPNSGSSVKIKRIRDYEKERNNHDN